MSTSVSWRERGNLLYTNDSDILDTSERKIKLKMAQNCYKNAIESAENKDEVASASKNMASVSQRLASLYRLSDTPEDVQAVKENTEMALKHFTKAFHAGKAKPAAWRTGLDNSMRLCLNDAMEWVSKFAVKFRLASLEAFITLLPESPTKAEAWFRFADTLFNLAVEELDEKEYQRALRYLKDTNFPLEEAKRMVQGGHLNLDFATLQSDIYVRVCVAEALQVKETAEDVLKATTKEEEFLNMDMAWQVVDLFHQALTLIRHQEVEMEAIIFSRLGYIYDKVIKMEERANRYYREASQLAHTSQFSYAEEAWFKETQAFLAEFQKKRVEDLEREDQKWREPIKKEMKGDLDKLEKQSRKEVVPFLEFIYKTWPPKKKDATLNKKVDGDKKTKEATMLRQALLHYHPDKQSKEGEGLRWFIICEEITKILTQKYEHYKIAD